MMYWEICHQSIKGRRWQWAGFNATGAGFLALYLAVFPTVQQQSANYAQIIAGLPKGVVAAFNISQAAPTLMGYLASKHFGFVWPLMIIFLMISYAAFALAREIETGTLGFLLSQPVSRLRLYAARWMSGLVGLGLFVVFSELIVWPLAPLFGYTVSAIQVMNLGVLGFLLGFAVLGISLLASSLVNEAGKVSASVGGILLVMYVSYLVASLEPRLRYLGYLSLFHYFSPGELIASGHLGVLSVVVLLVVGAVTSLTGALAFLRRDLAI